MVSVSCALPPRWPPQCSCVVIESSFDPGERLQAPGSLWLLLSLGRYLCWRTRLDFYVFVTITWSIPLLVDYRHHVYDPPKSGEMVIVTVPITLTEAVNLPAMFYLPSFDIYIFRCIFNSLLFGSYLLWYTLFLSGGMSRAVYGSRWSQRLENSSTVSG